MCRNCWIEEGGHKIENENTLRAVELIAAVYEVNPVGGNGHIVFDDFNIDDHSVDFCIADARESNLANWDEETMRVSLEALEHFKKLSHEERCSALGKYDGFF